ncbi:MAG: preprotein translocase subunit Sec61beta [Promethearchaeota archaeon]
MAKQKRQSARRRRRDKTAPMPMGGAGLIRFFQDSSQGIKIGPGWTIGLAITLIIVSILAKAGVFSWLLGAPNT